MTAPVPTNPLAPAKGARPWNWCRKCKQAVDVDDDSGDGSEHRCWGCGRSFALTVYEDGSCTLTVVRP